MLRDNSIGRAYDTACKSRTGVTCCLRVRERATTEVILITMNDNCPTDNRRRATQLNQAVFSFENRTTLGACNIAQIANVSIDVARTGVVLAKGVEVSTSACTALRQISELVNVEAVIAIAQSRDVCFVSCRLAGDL